MMTQRMLSVFLPALLGLFTWTALNAQSKWLPEDATPVQRQLIDEAGSQFIDYWNPRLNEYKRTIDRTLSPNDLEKLNAMRVRWGILMDRMARQMEQQSQVEMADKDDAEMTFDIGEENGEDLMEVMEIWMGTMALGSRYRSGLDNLSEMVVEDIGGFTTVMATFVDDYTELHRSELQGDEKGKELLSNRNEISDKIRKVGAKFSMENKGFAEVYSIAVEPLIMLYNGGSLGDLLPFISNQTSGADLDVVAGLLPQGGVLKQNYPNPASAKTTIPFTLAVPSTTTTLRVYASNGDLVETVELGAFEQGEHSYEIDVSSYAAGSYLYHLTVNTDEEEIIYSKVMQVVR